MKHLIAALCLLASTNTWAVSIGSVTENKGSACEIVRGKAKLPGAKGAEIESMDTYTTGACASSITFKDDTKVKITENSKLLIDDFVYDPKNSDAGKLSLKAAIGTVRYASGQIAKNNPQQVAVKTPTANIAVRGTDFTMTVDETGQSLIVLLPSCKDDEKKKEYELEENTCKVGKIEVTTLAGMVTLDKAFEGTFVASATLAPTPPKVLSITEGRIGNNLIIVQPREVVRAIRDSSGQTRAEEQRAAEDLYSASNQNNRDANDSEHARVLRMTANAKANGCNPSPNICVNWDRPEQSDIPQRGRGIAFRQYDKDHYSEIKTEGYSSNTTITINQSDNTASLLIGDGSPGGNVINIKQVSGVLRVSQNR
jgi:hypothetical protein